MIKNDENGVCFNGDGESITLEWIELTLAIANKYAEATNTDLDYCLNGMFETANIFKDQVSKEEE